MKKNLICSLILYFLGRSIIGQTQIPIPPIIEGTTFKLVIQNGTSELFSGIKTKTIGYNGNQLGPTLMLNKGSIITINVHNKLGDTTTTHWHGLHLAPKNDGSPHTPILAEETWSPTFEVKDNASTYWYHPHLHGKTLNQVVKGAAGFIIVHDAEEVLLNLPRTYGVDDLPLVFQWKTFDAYKQIVELDEEDNDVLVNGVVKGSTLSLPAQVVRLRLLNGSSHRFFNFGFENALAFNQIGGDGGLLDAPVSMSKLILAPGERAEILVDLTGKEGQNLTLRQYGSLLPQGYPGGRMLQMGGGQTMMGPLDNTDFDLMKVKVVASAIGAIKNIPATLTKNVVLSQVGATVRTFGFTAQPMMSMTNFYINGLKFDMEQINFSTTLGKTEIWTISNQTMMAHPFHVHGISFYVLSINGATPAANMRGRKDVITIPPMTGSVKIIMKFEDFSDPKMPYMYHCHILSHEDAGMMGQFIVNGSPTSDRDNLNDQFKMNVFPNPSTSSIRIMATLPEKRPVNIFVYNTLGQLVKSQYIHSTSDLNIPMDCQNWNNGLYLIKIVQQDNRMIFKFIKE